MLDSILDAIVILAWLYNVCSSNLETVSRTTQSGWVGIADRA